MPLCANISMLFAELPLARRPYAAAESGFDAAELQFVEAGDIAPLQAAIVEAGIPLVLINVPRGRGVEVGLAALPGREVDFRAAVAQCAEHAAVLGVRKVNVLAGRLPPGANPTECRRVLIDNLRHAGDAMDAIGVKVMVEPLNPVDMPGFFLTGLHSALSVLDDAAHPNLFLQFDLYHMAITEPDLCAALAAAGPRIGHVQFADAPGRHEPGTGGIDFAAALRALRGTGYRDVVSAEYRPAGATAAGLGWMAGFRKALS